jgi:putative ATP-dependent endonuclease of the OLD family
LRLKSVRILNFRSIRDVTVEFGAHTALIGGNGAGKSSILKAIDRFYSTVKTLEVDDYFGRDQGNPIEIELTFDTLGASALETFHSRVREGKLVVTRVFDTSAASGRYYGSVMQNPDFSAIRAQPTATTKREAYRDLRDGNPAYAALPAAGSAAAVDTALVAWEEEHPDQLELCRDDGQFFGFQNASRGALQKFTTFVFIPAVREAGSDASDAKSSPIGQLIELIVRSAMQQRQEILDFKAEMSARYQELVSPNNMPELGLLADGLTADIRGLYQDATVGLTWRPIEELPVPLPIADVSLSDDGFDGPVDRQGHGLQRAFIITLLQHLARTSATTVDPPEGDEEPAGPPITPNVILAIEEPELYQHPTKQRHFAEVLRALSDGNLPGQQSPTQVMFASHSPMFVSLSRADEIRLVRRADYADAAHKQCEIRSLNLDDVAERMRVGYGGEPGTYTAATLIPRLHILGVELAEGFFANGVVLVEGRSDKAALAAVSRLFSPTTLESAGIAVLSAEGKNNIDRPLAVFRELGIPAYPVWDCDRGSNKHAPAKDAAILRICSPEAGEIEALDGTQVGNDHTYFDVNLEHCLKAEISEELFNECLQEVCEPLGLAPGGDAQKIPEVMYQMLVRAQEQGAVPTTLIDTINSIHAFVNGEGQ